MRDRMTGPGKGRGKGKIIKKRDTYLSTRKKVCKFCVNKDRVIDYKDARLLESYIKDRGKILSARVTGNCARHQRKVAEAIKQARFISLIPYTRA